MTRSSNLLDVVETCYRVEAPESEWLGQLADTLVPFVGDGLGTAAFVYTRTPQDRLEIGELQMSPRIDPTWLREFLRQLPIDMVSAYRNRTVGYVADAAGFGSMGAALQGFGGAQDVFCIHGGDPSGQGVWVGAPIRARRKMGARRQASFSRIAAHLGAAHRLRRALVARATGLEKSAEAVLRPNGRLEHAEGAAQSAAARDVLRTAVVDLERVRGAAGRADPDTSLAAWRALVAARWAIVDHFDTDGRRFLVATSNEPAAPSSPRLSARECQVLSFAALGHHNKLIAYELGLSASTVRVLFHRAAAKLGVRTRDAAVATFLEDRRAGAG